MARTFCLLALVYIVFSASVLADEPSPLRVLFLGDNGHHRPAARFRQLQPVLEKRGIKLVYTDDVNALAAKTLAEYDALAVYANIDRIAPEQEKALLDYVAAGKGFVPIHCASACFGNSPKYIELVGAQFQRHGTGVFRTERAAGEHAIMKGFQPFESWDETYVHTRHNEKDRTVLEYRAQGVPEAERRKTVGGVPGAERARREPIRAKPDPAPPQPHEPQPRETREPWTWVRTHGKGRVFYTAWGHDERTWGNPGFQNLIERGIRWAAGKDPGVVPAFADRPEMTPKRKDVKPFEYVDAKVPFYPAGERWGTTAEPISKMQKPLPAEESLKHIMTPVGFEVRLFLDETMVKEPPLGKPIAMNWDERGRLWLCETVDYPNELQPAGKGRDRIRICEDTDNDGRADKFTVFADKLSIPTSLTFAYGGVVVLQAPHTLFLKDTNGDDRADERHILFTGWGTGDTHAGPSNLQYGLDNWIYGIVGYSGFDGTVAGEKHSFRQGFYRFKVERRAESGEQRAKEERRAEGGEQRAKLPLPKGEGIPRVSKLEFLRSTSNNSWGLGFSEEGHLFGSTANGNPSMHMAIPNRYYERVRGWSASVLGGIALDNQMDPITDKVRQVDHHGGFTSAAGHALYTARAYPKEYWNRTAFVCEPTGHLVATFVLQPNGASFISRNAWNLVASDDEWFAPIMAEVGPDGHVWVLDWYNYIVQHNPTPAGYRTGRGNAYETELRDKQHGRVYRVGWKGQASGGRPSASGGRDPASGGRQPPDGVAKGQEAGGRRQEAGSKSYTLAGASPQKLVAALKNDNMFWRKHAQRLLVERGESDQPLVDDLAKLLVDARLDDIGLNAPAVHVLWTAHSLGLVQLFGLAPRQGTPLAWTSVAFRRNAIQVRPRGIRGMAGSLGGTIDLPTPTYFAISDEKSHPQVRLAALLGVADFPADDVLINESKALVKALQHHYVLDDPWLLDAAAAAAVANDAQFLRAAASPFPFNEAPHPRLLAVVQRVAEHHGRGVAAGRSISRLLAGVRKADESMALALIRGLARGWPKDKRPAITADDDALIAEILPRLAPAARSQFIALASRWGSTALEKHTTEIADAFLKQVTDAKQSDTARAAAAAQLMEFRSSDAATAKKLLGLITPQTSPQLAAGLLEAVGRSEAAEVGPALVKAAPSLTPAARAVAVRVLLSRADWSGALVDGLDQGKLQLAELSLDQRQGLASHPDKALAARAKKLLERGGGLPSPDRQKVLDELMPLTKRTGDAAAGKLVFVKNCAKCHTHGSVPPSLRETVIDTRSVSATTSIGPDLSGMAVHPKVELLTQIIDPSRSVEGNFRVYQVLTDGGKSYVGLLASESKTAIELFDNEGKKQVILREEIEQLVASSKSIMPEGFEKQVPPGDIVNLLEFLAQRGKFLPLPLGKAATTVSTRGMFYSEEAPAERLIFRDWSPKTFAGVPFQLIDPRDGKTPNVILLYGPQGKLPPTMPKSVSLPCNAPAKAIHLLSGVSGWGFPLGEKGSVSMIVRLHYEGAKGADGETAAGKTEDHELRNGEHFADYIRRVDVPGSQFAFPLRGQQIRYLAIQPKLVDKIERIEFLKGPDATAPVVMAVTVEARD
jgi:putative membrane-bound dehydrogenase-like protein